VPISASLQIDCGGPRLPQSPGVLLLDANHLDRDLVAGDRNLEGESTVDCGLFGLPFPIDDQPIASGGKAHKSERERVGRGCMVFKGEAKRPKEAGTAEMVA
jgi:hypothetical protein